MDARRLLPSTLTILVCLAGMLSASLVHAQQTAGFSERLEQVLVVPKFTDAGIARLMTTLDLLLPDGNDAAKWSNVAERTLWNFARQLQAGRLTAAQEANVLRRLGEIEQAYPDAGAALAKPRHMVSALTIGKIAPDIVGCDLDGAEFRLSEYRGKVVVLTFSGDWCGICRSQYPYQRFLLELYKGWPFAIVGVDSSKSAEAAKQAKAQHGLPYRSWWDGRAGQAGDGPIASTWNVLGWPTVYVLDTKGVIRFVDLRNEDLLKGVRQLLNERK